ncbi:MAG: N-6 DNA methylase [Thermoplasmata archaeon]|nr:N-6 DNA methylase [Thermoplasmata archaeon]
MDDTSTLAGFIMLAGKERFLGKDNLSMLVQESQKRQVDVTDQLGEQVKDALDAFVRATNRYDKAMKGKPLKGMSEFEIYEMSLSVMMRLVFLLYAEENRLLPHGHFFYDQAYGVTHLWTELDRNKEQLAENKDAWQRLLSTFRLIYYGCKHPDFNMRAYGGHMFEPTRFPALEQLQLDNKTIHEIIRKLLFSRAKVGKEIVNQRVSYRTLDIEQLGSVYEGLMEYKVKRASEILVTFKGKTQEIRPLSEVAEVEEYAEKELTDYLKNITGFTDNKIKKHLIAGEEIVEDDSLDVSLIEDVDIIDTLDTETAPPEISEETPQFQVQSKTEKILPFINLDKVIAEGDLYLTREGSARKGSGSYYTPKQLTSFLVKEALEPLTHNEDKTIKKPKEILELKVCDPAMGSGAFLVQAIRYLSERLVESWDHEATQTEKRITIPYGLPLNGDLDQQILPEDREEALTWAKRFVVQNCIYGVDLNPLAVELAKMSLWLATLSKDRPFTFLDHRLRCGNSLIGAEFDKLASVPSEPLWKADKKVNDRALEKIMPFTEFQINNLVRSIITGRKDLSKNEQSILDVQEKEQLIGKMEEEGSNYDKIKDLCDLWCSVWFWPYEEQAKKSTATLDEFGGNGVAATESAETIPPPHTTRYHQVIRYLATGHADMDEEVCKKIVDTSHEVAKEQRFFHWELEFPEIFRGVDGGEKENPGFDAMVGNPPWEIVKPNSQEFFSAYDPDFRSYVKQKAKKAMKELLGDTGILQRWIKHSRSMEQQSVFYRKSGIYPHLGGGDINLYKNFLERFYQRINFGGYESIIVPSGIYMDKGTAPLRKLFLGKSQIKYLVCFENRNKIFPIDSRFKFVLFTTQKGDLTDTFRAGFMLHDTDVLNDLIRLRLRMLAQV